MAYTTDSNGDKHYTLAFDTGSYAQTGGTGSVLCRGRFIVAAHGAFVMTGHVPFLDRKMNDNPAHELARIAHKQATKFGTAGKTKAIVWHRR